MIKKTSFAALMLLATLTAVQAAIKNAPPNLPPAGASLQSGSPLKAKMPPRRTLSPAHALFGIEQVQFD